MIPLDSGICSPESLDTLRIQQTQLLHGVRDAQMFPAGTSELPLPHGFARHENARGVFHFQPTKISAFEIEKLSAQGRENEFLMLGPFSKYDVAKRIVDGDTLTYITEYTRDGIEIRSAAGSLGTLDRQRAYFERTKDPDSIFIIGIPPLRVRERLAEAS